MKQFNRPACITTSWDDGHVLDFRIADLLNKHGLHGTFYIPRNASTGVMSESKARELSATFEIGAHTMEHVFLDTVDNAIAQREILNSKSWVEQVTGKACPMFCPPGGKFSSVHVKQVRASGFLGLRSVELLSLSWPRKHGELLIMPTTLQAHPHRLGAYARNVLKRRAWGNCWSYVLRGDTTQWEKLTQSLLDHALKHGGVFHLWGHSWELEQHSQWERLDNVLRVIGQASKDIPRMTNGQVCKAAA